MARHRVGQALANGSEPLTGMTTQISGSPFNCDLRQYALWPAPLCDQRIEHGMRQGLAVVETLHQVQVVSTGRSSIAAI